MKVILPRCPRCRSKNTVGRVMSFDYENNGSMVAYFCSGCLTEFDKYRNILAPIWSTRENKKNVI